MKNLIAAIDLGTTKVVATIGEKTKNGVKIIAYSQTPSRGIIRGRVENPKLAAQAISTVIKNIEREHGLTIKKAFIGIAGQDIECISPEPFQRSRSNQNTYVTEEEVDDITREMYNYSLKDGYKVIDAIPQSFNVDNYMSTANPVGMMGKNILSRYKLIIGRENSINLINSSLQLANVQMINTILEPVASSVSVLTDDEMNSGVTLVDIGGGTTDVIVIQGNIIRYAGIIPFGSNTITEDISRGCKIAVKQAETIKKKYGSCFSDYAESNQTIYLKGFGGSKDVIIQMKVLAKIIQARMEEILDAVSWHIEQSGFRKTLIGGVVFTGGGSQIMNLTNLANFVIGMDGRVSQPSSYTIDEESVEEAKTSSAATAVGLVIQGFKMSEYRKIAEDSVVEYREENEYVDNELEFANVEHSRVNSAKKNSTAGRNKGWRSFKVGNVISKIKDELEIFNTTDVDEA